MKTPLKDGSRSSFLITKDLEEEAVSLESSSCDSIAEMCLNSNYSRVLCAEIIEDIVKKSVVKALDNIELDALIESSIESHHSDKPVEESPLKKIFDTVCDRMNTGPKKSLDDIFEEVLGEAGVKALSSKVECIEVLCSEECVSRDCNIIPYDVVQELSSRFQSMSSNKIHGYLLERLTLQKEMGFDSETVFILKGHRFCKGSLKSYFGISEYMVKTVRREHNNGQTKLIHGNKGNLYFSEGRSTVISFIQHFAEVHCENLPDKHCLQLPSYINIKTIYELYCERLRPTDKVISERQFYEIFNKFFGSSRREDSEMPRIVFQSHHTHPICTTCAKINDLRKNVRNETDSKYYENLKRLHMCEVRRKYLKFTYRRELPIRYPNDYCHIGIDDMDQVKLQSPHIVRNTKELSNLLKLKNHLTGVIVTNGHLENDGFFKAFLNNDQFCQDSNKTITIIFDVLQNIQNSIGKLPRKLMVQTDNCSKDLKNMYVLAFYFLLVEMGVFESVLVSHMPPGHTHNDVDFCFGLIAQQLKKLDIPTFEDLKRKLANIRIKGNNVLVEELIHTTDFKKFVEDGHLLQIQGVRSFSQFLIRKENVQTKLFVKLDELDDNFAISGGIKLLKNIPNKIKLEVSPFRMNTGYGEVYESIMSKYIPSLDSKFSEHQISQIKFDWEERIKFLIDMNQADYSPIDLCLLRPQQSDECSSIQKVAHIQSSSNDHVSISATFYPLEASDVQVSSLQKNTSLVFYTKVKKSRPWIGLLESWNEDQRLVTVQWLKKDKQKFKLHINGDGSPYLSSLEVESIMFADVLQNLSESKSREGPYTLDSYIKQEIVNAYKERDNALG